MSISTQKYIRKPFFIDAIRVTEDNFDKVAKWCGGTVKTEKRGKKDVKFIEVPVSRPMNDRQAKAFIGDWVLFSNGSWKVYTNQAFENSFELYMHDIEQPSEKQMADLGEKFKAGQS